MRRFSTWQLFAVCVVVWGTTWHAITYQIGELPAELGVAYRYAFAGTVVLALALARKLPLRYGVADHGLFAAQGALLYGWSYVCVYHAERFVPSGLVAVGYSASPLLTGLGASLVFGTVLTRRFVAGGVLGLVGVALIFWPEITAPSRGEQGAGGAALTAIAVVLSTIGSLVASRNTRRGVALLPAMGFGMLYGALAAVIAAAVLGRSIAWPTGVVWWTALVYLALFGSVLTFACFLTLQDRLGPAPAGTVGIMTPLLALAVSIAFEGFRPDVQTGVGALLAVAGNALMLRRAPSDRVTAAAASLTEAG